MRDIERVEVRMTKALKDRLIDEAAKGEGCSLGEIIVRLACRGVGLPESEGVPAKQIPGPKPEKSKRRRAR